MRETKALGLCLLCWLWLLCIVFFFLFFFSWRFLLSSSSQICNGRLRRISHLLVTTISSGASLAD